MCDDDESRSLAAEPYAEETGKKKKKKLRGDQTEDRKK